jgi:hypothetical protein
MVMLNRLLVLLGIPLALCGCVLLGLRAEAPTITPDEGPYPAVKVHVRIGCETPGATIHYTTDGSDPTAESPVYSGAIALTATATVKAIAMAEGKIDSAVSSAAYTLSKGGFTLAGRILYHGSILHATTAVGGQYFMVQDASGNDILNTGPGVNTANVLFYYDPPTSEYSFTNIPNQPIQVGITFDNVAGDYYALPGNFSCWDSTYLVTDMPAEDLSHDIFAVQHLNLLTPYDNSVKETPGTIRSYASPVAFSWAAVPDVAQYGYWVTRASDSGTGSPVTVVAWTSVGIATSATMPALPASAAGEHYELHMTATDASANSLCDLRVAFTDWTEKFALWFKVP